MGRASNRKKAQRRAGPGAREARQSYRADAATPHQLPDGLHELVQLARRRVEREADALTAWRGDAEILERIGHRGGNALETLVAAGAVPSAGVLPAGLTMLSALARLCLSNSASVLQRAT